jgi:hypothetical protein
LLKIIAQANMNVYVVHTLLICLVPLELDFIGLIGWVPVTVIGEEKHFQGMKTYAIMAKFVICVPIFSIFFLATFSEKLHFFNAKYNTHLCCWHNIIQYKT